MEIVLTLRLNCGRVHVENWWGKNAIKCQLFLLEYKMKNTNIKVIHYLIGFCTTTNIFRNVFDIDVKKLNDTWRLHCMYLFIYALFSRSILSGNGNISLCLKTRI